MAQAKEKIVFSEWPMARSFDEASDLAGLAGNLGSRTVTGLQARFAPLVAHARALIAEGFIGPALPNSWTVIDQDDARGQGERGYDNPPRRRELAPVREDRRRRGPTRRNPSSGVKPGSAAPGTLA